MKNDEKTIEADSDERARFERIMTETYRFVSRERAFSFANRAAKALWVMLGDDERFWVTTPANCARLERMGYEYAN
jgi:hypothetical protein